jgi:hypothetical protein
MPDVPPGLPIPDAKKLVYVPAWSRKVAIFGLLSLLATSIFVAVYILVCKGDVGGLIFSLSIAQTTATGLVLLLILLFSTRDENMNDLIRRSDEFVTIHVLRELGKITVPHLGISRFDVIDAGKKDIFGHLFVLKSEQLTFKVWIGLNVHRVFAIYFVKSDGSKEFPEKMKSIYGFTFGGAQKVGFVPTYEPFLFQGEPFLSIWLAAPTEKDLLTNPVEKLFWAQDIAMMTESFIRTSLRSGVELQTAVDPGPL